MIGMKKKTNKAIAIFIALSMTLSSTVYAEEIAEIEDDIIVAEEGGEEAGSRINSMLAEADSLIYDTDLGLTDSEVTAILAETADGISSLTAGEDYVSDEAFFTTDSEEKAQEVAEEYGAELASYGEGVAVLKFDRDIKDVFSEAANETKSSVLIQPNLIGHIDDEIKTADDDAELIDSENDDKDVSVESLSGHNDKYIEKQWFLDAISTNEAWSVTKGSGAKVAILDTGCDIDHEDLKGNIAEVYNVVNDTTDVTDNNGHGTHCAGTVAAAVDNGIGVAGVAPEAKLYIVKVTDDGNITIANMIKGLNKAAEWDVDVASMSFSFTFFILYLNLIATMQNVMNAVHNGGTVIVASAGNDHSMNNHYPAALNNVISVASAGYGMYQYHYSKEHTYSPLDPELAWYSNAAPTVDIIAPGGSASETDSSGNVRYSEYDNLSTIPRTISGNGYLSEGYGYMAGTSMATPVAAGVAALIYSANQDFINNNSEASAIAVEKKLIGSSDGKTYNCYYYHKKVTSGCLNACKAVSGDAKSGVFIFKRKDGTLIQNNSTAYISKGVGEKLTIVGADGKALDKAELKSIEWTSSNNDSFSFKNRKLKVNKNARFGDSTTITAACNGETITIEFIALEKIKKIGYRVSSNFYNKYVVSASVNEKIDISDVDNIMNPEGGLLTGHMACAFYDLKKAKSHDRGTRTEEYAYCFWKYGYYISADKKTTKMIKGTTFTPTKKGTYKIRFVFKDGSKKFFTVIYKVK